MYWLHTDETSAPDREGAATDTVNVGPQSETTKPRDGRRVIRACCHRHSIARSPSATASAGGAEPPRCLDDRALSRSASKPNDVVYGWLHAHRAERAHRICVVVIEQVGVDGQCRGDLCVAGHLCNL